MLKKNVIKGEPDQLNLISLQERKDSYQLSAHSKAEKLEQACQKYKVVEWAIPDGAHTQKKRPQDLAIPRRNVEAFPKCGRKGLGKSKFSWS